MVKVVMVGVTEVIHLAHQSTHMRLKSLISCLVCKRETCTLMYSKIYFAYVIERRYWNVL